MLTLGHMLLVGTVFCLPTPYYHNLIATGRFVTGDGGSDSWRPMIQALVLTQQDPSQDVHQILLNERGLKYQYPPTSLLSIAWVNLIPGVPDLATEQGEFIARSIFNLLAWLAVVGTMVITVGIMDQMMRQADANYQPATWPEALVRIVCILVLGLLYFPLVEAFALGQIQAWIIFWLALATFSLLVGWHRLAGCLVGLATLVKPQYGLILLWMLLRRRFTMLFSSVAVLLVAGLASLVLFGLSPYHHFISAAKTMGGQGEAFHTIQSFHGVLQRTFNTAAVNDIIEFPKARFAPYHPAVHAGTLVLAAVMTFVAVVIIKDGRVIGCPDHVSPAGLVIDFLTVLLCLTLATPIAWDHHFGVLFFVLAALLPLGLGRPQAGRYVALIVVAFTLTAHRFPFTLYLPTFPGNILMSYVFAGALLALMLLLRWRVRLIAAPAAATQKQGA